MREHKSKMRLLDRLDPPDLWDEIERRRPSDVPPSVPTPSRRFLVAVVAFVIAAAGIGFVVRAFAGGTAQPGTPSPTLTAVQTTPSPEVTPSPTPVQFSPTVPTTVAATIDVGGPPGAVSAVASAFGSVWVSGYTGGQSQADYVLRIDPSTNQVVARIHTDTVPTWETGGGGMAAGDGSLWIAGVGSAPSGGKGQAIVERIDPATNQVISRIDLGGQSAADVAIDSSGVWVAMFGPTVNATQVVRIDPSTNKVVATIPLESSFVRSIYALDGTLIVAERQTQGSGVGDTFLAQIDPATNQVVGSKQLNVGLGEAYGELWGTTADEILKIDPATLAITQSWSSSHTGAPVPSADGVWLLSLADQSVSRFIPDKAVIDASIDLKQDLVAVAETPNALWVLTYSGSLLRVNVG